MISTTTSKSGQLQKGFTLTELLVVVALIVAMLMILLPALQAFQRGRIEQAANMQLAADMNNARHLAMLNGAPVYMVFFPKLSHLHGRVDDDHYPEEDNAKRINKLKDHVDGSSIPANMLLSGQLTAYALYAETSAGDQPTYAGSDQELQNKVYLSPWKRLPSGSHFTSAQLHKLRHINDWVEGGSDFTRDESGNYFAAPRPRGLDTEYGLGISDNNEWDRSLELPLPYIGFGPRGQLVGVNSTLWAFDSGGILTPDPVVDDGFFSIEIATGAVLPLLRQEDDPTFYDLNDVDAEEERMGFSKYNRIRLNMLTGRSESHVCDVFLTMKHIDTGELKPGYLPRPQMAERIKVVIDIMRERLGRQAPSDEVIDYRFGVGKWGGNKDPQLPNPRILEGVSTEKAMLFENLLYAELRRWLNDPNVSGALKNRIKDLSEDKWRLQLIFD